VPPDDDEREDQQWDNSNKHKCDEMPPDT